MSEQDDHKAIIDKLDDIWKILNGNGKTGVCAKVNIMWWMMLVVIGTALRTFLF